MPIDARAPQSDSLRRDESGAHIVQFDYHLVKPVDPNDLHGLVGTVRREVDAPWSPSTVH